MQKILLLFLAMPFVISTAYAQDNKVIALQADNPATVRNQLSAVAHSVKGCTNGMQEAVNLSVSFNMKAKSFAEAKTVFDQKMQQLNDYAGQQKVGKFELQSMNYNIRAQVTYEGGMPEQGYQLSGSANYNLDSADAAFKLAEFLTQQKFQVNVGVNKYRNASCNNQ